MSRPKYTIGDTVRLVAGDPDGDFRIVARDFLNTTAPSYRIRSLLTGSERRATEEELARVAENGSVIASLAGAKIVPFLRPVGVGGR